MKTETKKSDLIFRRATTADIPVLLKLEKSVSGTNIYSAMLEEEEWEEELQRCVVYLLEKDGEVAGNVSFEEKPESRAYVSGLVVDPRFSRRGIAREALLRVLGELKDFKRIDLVTHPDNKAALCLYQSLGFAIESRKENYYGDGEPRLILSIQKS